MAAAVLANMLEYIEGQSCVPLSHALGREGLTVLPTPY